METHIIPETEPRTLHPGRIYRHFKGNLYLVEAVARSSETGEDCVVYRALYGEGGLWVRPKEMFMSRVDREKYPDCEQEFRFQLTGGTENARNAGPVQGARH